MSGAKRYDDHARLVEAMAGTLGVDLAEETMAGRWTPDDMAATVTRCMGCTDPVHCQGWLEENAAGTGQTPGYCRNKDLLAALRTRLAPA